MAYFLLKKYIVWTNQIRSTRREPPTMGKQLAAARRVHPLQNIKMNMTLTKKHV